MQFQDVVRKRRMTRNFTDEPVSEETVHAIVDMARRAPSAGNTQGQSFIIVRNSTLKQGIANTCHEPDYVAGGFDPFISKAPVLILVCTREASYHERYGESDKLDDDGKEIEWPVPYWHVDAGCAAMVVLLAAVDAGLAAGYAGVIQHEAIRQLLGIPADVTVIGVIPIGHPAEDKKSPSLKRGRKPFEAVVHVDGWNQ